MDYSNQSLSYHEIIDIGVQMSLGDGPFPRNDMEEKEREVVHSNSSPTIITTLLSLITLRSYNIIQQQVIKTVIKNKLLTTSY